MLVIITRIIIMIIIVMIIVIIVIKIVILKSWTVELTSEVETLGEVKVNRDILNKRDILSQILFAVTLITLSILLKDMKAGYMLGEFRGKINNLIFMNDLKRNCKTM